MLFSFEGLFLTSVTCQDTIKETSFHFLKKLLKKAFDPLIKKEQSFESSDRAPLYTEKLNKNACCSHFGKDSHESPLLFLSQRL